MFFEVAKTMMKISFMMIFFIMAIAIPYNVMVNQDGFRHSYTAGLSTFAMALGELNFKDNFIDANNGSFSFDLTALFPICCIILNCSLMNLMIGVAVGDISRVEKKAYLSRLRTHIYYLVEAEMLLCPIHSVRLRKLETKLIVRPNTKSKSFNERIKRLFLHCEQISFIKNTEARGSTDQVTSLTKEVAAQKTSIEKLMKTTDDILSVLQKMNTNGQEAPDVGSKVSPAAPAYFSQLPLMVKEAQKSYNI